MRENVETLIAKMSEGALLYRLTDAVFKLDTPPVTSLFFVRGEGNAWYVIDAGAKNEHTEEVLLWAFEQLGIAPKNVLAICTTHDHWDHVDGLPIFLKYCTNASVYGYLESLPMVEPCRYRMIRDGAVIGGLIQAVETQGHSDNCISYLDLRSRSLFSGDAIQMYGVSTSGMFVFGGIRTYLSSMERLRGMEIDCIYSAHPYMPLGAYAMGRDAALEYLDMAIACMEDLISFVLEKVQGGVTDVQIIKQEYMKRGKARYSDFPVDGFTDAIKGVMEEYAEDLDFS